MDIEKSTMLRLFTFLVIILCQVEAKPENEAPQTILVNNMELPAVRTNLSEKDVDFSAEYQYEDGDVVNVICVNKRSDEMLTMEYKMAGTMSDESIMNDLKSSKAIGFVTKLHSGHNNSYMICTCTKEDDYTKVMVKFVMRTKFKNIVFVKINGIILRPYLDNPTNNYYRIDYKYVMNQKMNVMCEVEQPDMKVLVFDDDFVNTVRSYKKEPIQDKKNKKVEMRFFLSREKSNKKIDCASDYLNGTSAEIVTIYFTEAVFPIDRYPLHLELPSNGKVMELYNYNKLNVIFYEFNNGETLQLNCGQLHLWAYSAPVLYLELDSEICETDGCSVSKTLHITSKDDNTEIVCYLKRQRNPTDTDTYEPVLRKIRVILRERVLTTATSTSTTTSNHTAANPASKTSTDVMESANQDTHSTSSLLLLGSSLGAVLVFIAVIVAAYCFIKTRKTKENPDADLSNKNDILTSKHSEENENQYDLCHYSDHQSNCDTSYNTPEGEENMDPKDHHYTEIDYSSCKPKICETQPRNSRVYDEPYVHINVKC